MSTLPAEPVEMTRELFAVIDIGATSIRMMIAQVDETGEVRAIENLAQAVSLGKDSFIDGVIHNQTIEDCVRVLQIYRDKLFGEYQVQSNRVRVVATSAVKEARNQQAFQDRVYIATGLEIDPFDEAELHRVTYLGALPFLESEPELGRGQTVICEVGGGSTELLILKQGRIVFTRTYRLGALRMRKLADSYHLPFSDSRALMESQVNQTVDEFRSVMNVDQPVQLITMGGDMRLAASKITGQDPKDSLVQVGIETLQEFVNGIMTTPPEQLVLNLNLSFPEAESLFPALLVNLLVARGLNVDWLYVANANMRNGLIKEMAFSTKWSQAIETQMLQSAFNLGRKFQIDETHARHVADLATQLFGQTESIHKMSPRYELLLRQAALLHEIGRFIGYRGSHKHSQYIIRNSDLFGLGALELEIVAQVARYHRRALPQPRHEGYVKLKRSARVIISKLAALLRLAKALDITRRQKIASIQCSLRGQSLLIGIDGAVDSTLEELALREESELFEQVFGLNVRLQNRN